MSVYNNQIAVVGKVGKDAEIKEIGDIGTVARFPLAVYRTGKGDTVKTDWFNVECWHDLARGAFEKCVKGARVIVVGSMKFDQYEKDGIKQNRTSLAAREIGLDIAVDKGQTDEDPF